MKLPYVEDATGDCTLDLTALVVAVPMPEIDELTDGLVLETDAVFWELTDDDTPDDTDDALEPDEPDLEPDDPALDDDLPEPRPPFEDEPPPDLPAEPPPVDLPDDLDLDLLERDERPPPRPPFFLPIMICVYYTN